MRTRAEVDDVRATDAVSTVVVSPEEEHAVVAEALVRHGATPDDAALQATTLVEGDLRGHASHGIRRLPVLVGRLDAGVAVSGVELGLEWRTESALAVDGRRSLGPVAAHRALDLILERAATSGIALASIRNAGHVGMLAPYLERIVASGNAGIALTVSEALVHPWGGTTAMVGTNPIGIGIPTLGEPFILDMSTSEVSVGKIIDHAARGVPIPLGWAIDSNGQPTTSAEAGLQGAMLNFGSYKGSAIATMIELLAGPLIGDFTSLEAREHDAGANVTPRHGELVIAFNPETFLGGDAEANIQRAEKLFEAITGQGARLPSQRRYEARARSLASNSVTIPRKLYDDIVAMYERP